MAIILINGKTIEDRNGEVRSTVYGIMSRMNINFTDSSAYLHIDIFATEAIRDLKNVNKRIDEIQLHVQGADFTTYLASCADAGYSAMNSMDRPALPEATPIPVIDDTVWVSDE